MVALLTEPFPELAVRGARVTLRPPRRSDHAEWAALRERSRSFLSPWEPTWPPDALTRATYRRRLRRLEADWRADLGYSFHILADADAALVGGVALTNIRRGVALAGYIGYWVGQPFAYQGYMTEAVRLVQRFAFEDLGLHRIEAACLPRNAASCAVLRKSGFVQEGLARRYLRINGAWEDHLLFAILREDWPHA